ELEPRRLGEQVDLVQDDRLWPLVEAGAVLGELVVDLAELLPDVARGHVDHVQQQPRAFEVREKLVPEPDTLARALDQPRHVADGAVLATPPSRFAAARLEDALRTERGEVAQVGVGDQNDVAAASAVPAVRPALGDELLAAKAQPAVAATSGLHRDAGPIVEH